MVIPDRFAKLLMEKLMVNYTTPEREIFWKILFHLEDLKAPVKLDFFLKKNELTRSEFFIFTEYAHSYGLSLNQKSEEGDHTLLPLSWHREFGDTFTEKSEYKELVKDIQNCVETQRVCKVKFADQSEMEVFPWRILFFENNLSVIAEDINTKRLITIELEEVEELLIR